MQPQRGYPNSEPKPMKKILCCAAVLTAMLFGCSEKSEDGTGVGDVDGETGLKLDKTVLSLKYGDTEQIFVVSGDAGRCNWSSDNEFVATVDSEGNVKARHVGTADITVVSGTHREACKVEVLPQSELFVEPVLDFGASQAQIIAKEKRELKGESLRTLVFGSSDSRIESVIYVFEEGRMTEAVVSFYYSASVAGAMKEFLRERYELTANTDNRIFTMFGNGVVVVVELPANHILLSYTQA